MELSQDGSWTNSATGDVSIVLGAGHNYTLHSWVLRQHSQFFRNLLTDDNSPVAERRAKEQGKVRWKLELVERPEADDTGAGVLELLHINEKGQTLPQGRRCPTDNTNGKVINPIYLHYDRVLGSLYGIPFRIDDENITSILRDVLGIIEVAEYIDCIANISRTVETAMLSQGLTLHRSISGNPGAWSTLATRVHSELVFKEAVIHLVGRWNEFTEDFKADLHHEVRKVCERKNQDLDKKKQAVEHSILKYYPGHLHRDANDHSTAYNRQSYSNDIMGWVGIALYKHWFASVLVQDRHRKAADGGFWLYNVIGEGGHSYLAESDIAAFHKRFPMTGKGSAVFHDQLINIKQDVRRLVEPLMYNYSQLDPKEYGLKYLTCTEITKQDLPWFSESPVGLTGNNRFQREEFEEEEQYDEMEDQDQ